jgi:hypothetical protein
MVTWLNSHSGLMFAWSPKEAMWSDKASELGSISLIRFGQNYQ